MNNDSRGRWPFLQLCLDLTTRMLEVQWLSFDESFSLPILSLYSNFFKASPTCMIEKPEYYTVLIDFHINTYSTTTTTQGKPDITMDRYGGTQQRYLISGPLYCVLYNSWKWLECTVWHVFLWRVSLWIENEPIIDNDSCAHPWRQPHSQDLSSSHPTSPGSRVAWPTKGHVPYINILTRLPFPFSVIKKRAMYLNGTFLHTWLAYDSVRWGTMTCWQNVCWLLTGQHIYSLRE